MNREPIESLTTLLFAVIVEIGQQRGGALLMASSTKTAGHEKVEQNWLTQKTLKISKKEPLSKPNKAFNELKEDKYKAELQLVDRYQSFVAELLRLSLLGIAVFGFIYTRQIFQGLGPWEYPAKILAALSIIAFGISALSALAFRYFAVEGARYYIEALRFLPTNVNLPTNVKRAEESLHARMKKIYLARITKLCSAVSLGVGGFLVAACIITLVFASAPTTSTVEQIKKLDELRKSQTITEGEFEETKDRLLARL